MKQDIAQPDEWKSIIQSTFSKYFDVTEIETNNETVRGSGGKIINNCFHAIIYINNSKIPIEVQYDTKSEGFYIDIWSDIFKFHSYGHTLNEALTNIINSMSEQLADINNIINSFNK